MTFKWIHDHRAELDVNRRLGSKLAVRVALVAQHENAFQHYAGRDFYGVYSTLNYCPLKNTNINFEFEYRLLDGVMTMNTLTEAFSTTDRTPTSFTTLVATLLDDYGRYLAAPSADVVRDGVVLRQEALALTRVEHAVAPIGCVPAIPAGRMAC